MIRSLSSIFISIPKLKRMIFNQILIFASTLITTIVAFGNNVTSSPTTTITSISSNHGNFLPFIDHLHSDLHPKTYLLSYLQFIFSFPVNHKKCLISLLKEFKAVKKRNALFFPESTSFFLHFFISPSIRKHLLNNLKSVVITGTTMTLRWPKGSWVETVPCLVNGLGRFVHLFCLKRSGYFN